MHRGPPWGAPLSAGRGRALLRACALGMHLGRPWESPFPDPALSSLVTRHPRNVARGMQLG
eukprot:6923182-Pyramimonas_sp.AAC.1